MKKYLSVILLIAFAAITLAACKDLKSQGPSEDFYRISREVDRREDSIKAAQKAQHDEYIRQLVRDIVKSGSNGRNYKEPTDGKQINHIVDGKMSPLKNPKSLSNTKLYFSQHTYAGRYVYRGANGS